jgi:hypothetical protein
LRLPSDGIGPDILGELHYITPAFNLTARAILQMGIQHQNGPGRDKARSEYSEGIQERCARELGKENRGKVHVRSTDKRRGPRDSTKHDRQWGCFGM